jgi:hypothetical protein
MFCCCEPLLNPEFESDQPGSQVSTFPGDRRFVKTGGNALTAANSPQNAATPQYGAPHIGAPQQTAAPQYGAQAPPTSTHAEKVVAGTSNLL